MTQPSDVATALPKPPEYFVEHLRRLGRMVRDAVLRARKGGGTAFAGVSRHTAADTIYELDTHVEPIIERFCEHWSHEMPLVLIAEGVEGDGGREGFATFPKGTPATEAAFRLIVDPIDGTRGLMYDKRSAWCLMGVAPNNLDATRLSDIEVAVQVEVPTSKQTLADVLWASRGRGVHALRDDLATGNHSHVKIQPSTADTIAHGFGMISNFFPGTKVLSSELMERIVERTIGPADVGKAMVFEDQYISTGGQFYEMILGHDRFNADLRPVFYRIQNQPPGLCVHPYDVASVLIAREAGLIITDGLGRDLDGPLDVETPLAWAGFANAALRERIEPIMLEFFREKGLPVPA